jgi:hypothetical protein
MIGKSDRCHAALVAASFAFVLVLTAGIAMPVPAGTYDVTEHGAVGDGRTLDTAAINRTIELAAAAGGGTVYFPAGKYLSYSIRLKSNIALYLSQGAAIVAAEPTEEAGYDPAEPNPWGDKFRYQDFGHSHWHDSLIWGENLENISILGPGMIDGSLGLDRDDGRRPRAGNKIIALKLCRNVIIRDITMYRGGHFCILPTGVDNLTIDNVRIDTNRDGINIDCCRNVRISNCTINSPNDDALVLKSSFALGYARATENVTITNCQVSGYDIGTLLDGTFRKTQQRAPDNDGPTGRIKFGTESNGGFRNVTISNCVFDHCRGVALETVDGGLLEDITISNITMREITNAPLFLRLGSRMRGPDGTPVGAIRRVLISNVFVYDADPRYASIISGIPGHYIEDVTLDNVHILHKGGISLQQVAQQPAEMVNTFFFRSRGGLQPREPYDTPERENDYPEPSMFGLLPAHGLFIRHVDGLHVSNLEVGYKEEDTRPAFVLEDVRRAGFSNVRAEHAADVPTFILKNVEDFSTHQCKGLPDTQLDKAEDRSF